MYDPSELIHDTRIRASALTQSHIDRPATEPVRPLRGLPRLPVALVTTVAAVFLGGWLL